MGGLSIARGLIGGVAGAAGDPQTQQHMEGLNQQAEQQKTNDQRAKIAPLALNIKNLKGVLANTPQGTPEYNHVVDQIQQNVHGMREVLHPDWKPGPTDWLKTHITDRAHITNAAGREAEQNQKAQETKGQEQQIATAQVGSVVPNPLTPEQQKQSALIKANLAPGAEKNTTDEERFVENYRKDNPGSSYEQAVQAHTDATNKTPAKTPKGLEVNEKGGVFLGIKNGDTGADYLPSQLAEGGNAPPEAKEMWKQVQQKKQEKLQEEHAKEDASLNKQARTIGAAFERMGAQQQFQENMAQFRAGLTEYRGLSAAADQSEETVNALEAQYAKPGNKAVADNELQNFYTSVVQKGGRKTAAELALTLKIGSWGMNIETMAQRAATGELPDPLRKDLLRGMKAVAKEQRTTADQRKPELPEITAPSGAKHKQLKATRSEQGKSLSERLKEALK